MRKRSNLEDKRFAEGSPKQQFARCKNKNDEDALGRGKDAERSPEGFRRRIAGIIGVKTEKTTPLSRSTGSCTSSSSSCCCYSYYYYDDDYDYYYYCYYYYYYYYHHYYQYYHHYYYYYYYYYSC